MEVKKAVWLHQLKENSDSSANEALDKNSYFSCGVSEERRQFCCGLGYSVLCWFDRLLALKT